MGKRIAQIFTQSGIEDFSTRKTYPCKRGCPPWLPPVVAPPWLPPVIAPIPETCDHFIFRLGTMLLPGMISVNSFRRLPASVEASTVSPLKV